MALGAAEQGHLRVYSQGRSARRPVEGYASGAGPVTRARADEPQVFLGPRASGLGRMTLSNARSNAPGLSSTSTWRAVSTKRAWRSASVSLGLRGCFAGMAASYARCGLVRQRDRRRLPDDAGFGSGPALTKCPVGQALAREPVQRAVSARLVIDAQLDPVAVPEIELGQVAVQMLGRAVLID